MHVLNFLPIGNGCGNAPVLIMTSTFFPGHSFANLTRITAWLVLASWLLYLPTCSVAAFGFYNSTGHSHDAHSASHEAGRDSHGLPSLSHEDKHKTFPGDSGNPSDCCEVPQNISLQSLRKTDAMAAFAVVPPLLPHPYPVRVNDGWVIFKLPHFRAHPPGPPAYLLLADSISPNAPPR